ncbi:hypothetical protein ACFFIR_15780 [Microbacterium arthrosphaerae]|uniref:hypothetical protein n=1 Tax=Microbacterium TaxID=33882 RepID=UPI0035ED0120
MTLFESAGDESLGEHTQHRGQSPRGQVLRALERQRDELGPVRVVIDRVAVVVDHGEMPAGDLSSLERLDARGEAQAQIGCLGQQPVDGELRHPARRREIRHQRPTVELGSAGAVGRSVWRPCDGGRGIRQQPDLGGFCGRPALSACRECVDQAHHAQELRRDAGVVAGIGGGCGSHEARSRRAGRDSARCALCLSTCRRP